jgi:hypothetical protein
LVSAAGAAAHVSLVIGLFTVYLLSSSSRRN